MLKKIVLIIFCTLLCTTSVKAYDFCVGGIYYTVNFESMSLKVTYGEEPYRGKITIPNEVEYNGKTLPVTEIEGLAFCNDDRLTFVYIPSNVKKIGPKAFYKCTSLRTVIMEDGVEDIDQEAFYECTSLKELTLSGKLETINEKAFYNTNLPLLVIPNSVRWIGRWCFYRLDKSKNISSGPESIVIEDGDDILIVASNGLGQSGGKKQIYLGRDIDLSDDMWRNFGSWSREMDHIEKLTIGEKVKDISQLFRNCKELKEIYAMNKEPISVADDCFPSNVYANAILYVPEGSVIDYSQEPGWNRFFQIKEISASHIKENISDSENNNSLEYNINGTINKVKKGIIIRQGKKYIYK